MARLVLVIGGITYNIQSVQYSTNYVYIKCSTVANYTVGPWPANTPGGLRLGICDPLITSWIGSTGTGYGGITYNIQSVQYSTNYVYIKCSTVANYTVGPWPANTPKDQNYTFQFPRSTSAPATKSSTPLGNIQFTSMTTFIEVNLLSY